MSTPPTRLRAARKLLAVVALLAIPVAALPANATDTEAPPKNTDPQSTDNLDPATLATMRHQESLQPALHAIYDEYAKDLTNGFAGLAFEGDGLTLYYKGKPTAAMDRALIEARKTGKIAVKSAKFSMTELETEGKKIHSKIKQRGTSDIQAIHYKHDGSGLKVEKLPVAAAQARQDAWAKAGKPLPVAAEKIVAEARLGVPVEISIGDSVATLKSRQSDSAPWNGGGRWESWRGGDHRMNCTTGFGVNASGRTWVLSAAHCGSLGDTAFQGVSGGGAGTSFTQMGPINSDQWQYDMLLIDAPGWYLIFDGNNTTNNTKKVYNWGYWAVDELVCHSGMTSGVICGLKQTGGADLIVNCATPDSDGDCGYTVSGLIRTTQINGSIAARGGDSGGPVFTLLNDGVRAKGTLTGGSGTTMYFQDWHDAIRLFGAYPRTP